MATILDALHTVASWWVCLLLPRLLGIAQTCLQRFDYVQSFTVHLLPQPHLGAQFSGVQ
jgi:hypothetical protein